MSREKWDSAEALGVGTEHGDAELLHALFVLLGGGGAEVGLRGDQRGEEDHDAVIARRDLLVGQAGRAQGLQHFLHDQPGSGATGPVAPPDRGELGLLAEGLAQAPGQGGDALLPVALGAVAVHGGQQDPVGDRAQQFGLVAEVPVEAGGVGPERGGELAHAEGLGVARAQQCYRRVEDLLGRPSPAASHLAPLVRTQPNVCT